MTLRDLFKDLTNEQLDYNLEMVFKVVKIPNDKNEPFKIHADDPVIGIAISDENKEILLLGTKIEEQFKKLFPEIYKK